MAAIAQRNSYDKGNTKQIESDCELESWGSKYV